MSKYELVRNAAEVPYEEWADRGVKVVLFDKDGTLTHANQLTPVDGIIEELQKRNLDQLFTHLGVSSNNYDAAQVEAFATFLEESLGLGVLALSPAHNYKKKPHPEMGLEAARQLGVLPSELGIVGDRRYTDVGFGINVRAKAIALCEKAGEGDTPWVPTLRRMEKFWVGTERALRRAS